MRGAVVIRICEHCGESYRYAHTCPPPKDTYRTVWSDVVCERCGASVVGVENHACPAEAKVRLLIGKLRDVQRACVGLDELLREVEP